MAKKKVKKSKPSGNVIKKIVREVVKEELKPIKGVLGKVEERMERRFFNLESRFGKLEDKVETYFRKFRDEVLTSLDPIMGEIKAVREEQAAHTLNHEDINDRLDTLESIHPAGQHGK